MQHSWYDWYVINDIYICVLKSLQVVGTVDWRGDSI